MASPDSIWLAGPREVSISRSVTGFMSGRSVTLLVFLAAAARAGIVASHFRLVAAHGPRRRVVAAGARRHRWSAFAACSGSGETRQRRFRARLVHRDLLRLARLPHFGRARFAGRLHDRPEPPEVAHDLVVDALLHGLEEREALLLV